MIGALKYDEDVAGLAKAPPLPVRPRHMRPQAFLSFERCCVDQEGIGIGFQTLLTAARDQQAEGMAGGPSACCASNCSWRWGKG